MITELQNELKDIAGRFDQYRLAIEVLEYARDSGTIPADTTDERIEGDAHAFAILYAPERIIELFTQVKAAAIEREAKKKKPRRRG